MGCFPVLKSKKKKKHVQSISNKSVGIYGNPPVTLPEPQTEGRSLHSAPPSFRTRAKPVQPVTHVTNNRIRALSAPSSLSVAERIALLAVESDEQEDNKARGGLGKDQWGSNAQPLPLPSPQKTSPVLKNMGSFKSSNISGPLLASGPLPLPPLGGLRSFSFDEIASACQHFSPERCVSEGLSSTVYKASFGDEFSGSRKLEATVTRLLPSPQGFKEFVNEINTIASLQHPQLCKLIGFYAREGSEQRMLVYERLFHGSLDRLLYGRSDGPPIDWNARVKVALCAAQGLVFLHEEGPFQAMYNEFSAANIQIDKDFSAKLSGYGCVSLVNPDAEFSSSSSPAMANLSVETVERGLLTPKSNVWSFGVVLLELLTGRRNLDSRHPKEERNLVKWSRPFLTDDYRLSLIMDSRLKGRFSAKAARIMAEIALKCLQKDPSERPTMRATVESLKQVQDMRYSCRFPLQEPAMAAGKQMLRSPSLNGIVTQVANRLNFSPSPPARIIQQPSVSVSVSVSPSTALMPLSLPPRTCASTVSLEGNPAGDPQKLTSPVRPRAGVEGF